MWDEMQAPVTRKDFQEWAGAEYRLYENIRQTDGSVMTCTRHDLLPDVCALFVCSPENLRETLELCGLYDKKRLIGRMSGSFLYTSKQGVDEKRYLR